MSTEEFVEYLKGISSHFWKFTPKFNADMEALRGTNIYNYFIVYLFPFVLPENQIAAAISLIVLLIVVGYFYIETDLIFLNPKLYLFGYKVYKIYFEKEEPTENEEFQSAWLIASKLEKNMEVKELSKELYLGL